MCSVSDRGKTRGYPMNATLNGKTYAGNSHVRFVGCLILSLLCLSGVAEEPFFRAGWLSDTHTGSTRESFDLVKKAMLLFREQKVDAVIHNGDISDHHDPVGYAIYRQVMDETFAGAGKKPVEIYAWAWHDIEGWKGPLAVNSGTARRKASFVDGAKLLGIRHRMTDRFEIGGHVFVVVLQFLNDVEWKDKKGLAAYELILQEAERDCGGRPIFVIDHAPPARTIPNSANSDEWKRKLYAKHPGVISLSGHVHGSLCDENHIWQGEFTAVNAATLHACGGDGYCCVLVEGFGDRIVFRRFDVRDGREIAREKPWIVPWPFDPKTAPYSFERRVRTTPVPEFAADARVIAQANEPFTGFTLVLPSVAVGADSAYLYRVAIAEKTADGWKRFKTAETWTQFNLRPSERQENVRMPFSAAYFTAGRRYLFAVKPVNFFGVAGKPTYGEATAPEMKKVKVIWESVNPMEELKIVYGYDSTDKGTPVEKVDGWYRRTSELPARLIIPPEAWIAPVGTKLCLVLDMETVQNSDANMETYKLGLMRYNPSVLRGFEMTGGFVRTPHGVSDLQRYVIEFTKGKDIPYQLVATQGAEGKIRFRSVKVLSFDP